MPSYDLAHASADFPAWNGPPKRSIVICSHARSGTTLLGEAIRFAGGLGCPLEYLHRGFRPAFEQRFGTPELDAYVAALHRHRTDPSGTFSIKLFWQDLEEVAHERDPARFPEYLSRPAEATSAGDYRDFAALIEALMPNPVYVHLERRDRLRQAVSAMVATQTGVWRQIPGVDALTPRQAAEYDYDRILATIAVNDYGHDHWRGFSAANRIAPYAMTYEDMVGDFTGQVGGLLRHLGAENPVPVEPRMRRQSDDASNALALRFLQDHAARG